MRILLDECLPRALRRGLAGHDAATVQQLGWAGVQNGALLRRAIENGFAVFLTVDKGIEFQQNIRDLDLAVIALASRSNDISDLLPLMPGVLALLESVQPGQFIRLAAPAR